MGGRDTHEITRLLAEVGGDDPGAADRLWSLVYRELKRIARGQMAAERKGDTLQPTALVHEAYLRLLGQRGTFEERKAFFLAAAEAMRRILIDRARRRRSAKRGGQQRRVPLSDVDLGLERDLSEILAVDEAFSRLEQEAPDAAAVVRLRFYAGLSPDETAAALGVSPRSVYRDWTFARAWLRRELGSAAPSEEAKR